MLPSRILIAGRDPALLIAMRDRLSREGWEVATSADGLDCLAKLRRFRPAVLAIDPDLPWGRGDGVLALMDEEPELPRIPVILLTSRGDSVTDHPEPSIRREGFADPSRLDLFAQGLRELGDRPISSGRSPLGDGEDRSER